MANNLLIVDDSIFVYEEMKHILNNTEFSIVGYAKDGETAIKLYEELKPDIVTLDIILPGIDGLETAKQILSRWPDARIVMVSSLAYDETMSQAKSIGAKDFLFKPLEEDKIIDVLSKAIK